jgi:TRAP-type C4-dicarboxylate transport system permease small subunit
MLGWLLIGARLIEKMAAALVAILVGLALCIVLGQFIDRHFFDLPWEAPDQFARIAVIWLCFVGTALALSRGDVIRIDLLDHIVPRWAVSWRDMLFDVVLLALLLLLAVKGWTVVRIGSMQILLGTPFTADLPYSGLFTGAVTGAILIAARLLRRLIERAAGRPT